jgi:hypothetical protein
MGADEPPRAVDDLLAMANKRCGPIGTSMMPLGRSSRAFDDAQVGHCVAIGRGR